MIATEKAPEIQKIIDLLVAAEIGGIVTLAAMSEAIGRDITLCRGYLYTAIRCVQRDNGIVFSCQRRIGYRRLPAAEMKTIGQVARAKIRRTARRGAQTIHAGIWGANDLSDSDRAKLAVEQSTLAMLEHVARERNLPKADPTETKPKPLAETARAFLAHIGAI